MRKSLSLVFVATLASVLLNSPATASGITVGSKCSIQGQVTSVSGKTYKCTSVNKKLIWKQIQVKPIVKLKSSDIQFFYATGGCRNEMGFLRMDETGKVLSKKVVIKTNLNIQVTPEAYESGQLLFSTYNCGNSEMALYNLNVGQNSYRPSEILKFQKGTMIIDAKWDVATDTPLALVSYGAKEFVVMTANVSQSTLWSSTAQGWGQKGIYPKILISSTGREFTVFGDNLDSGGWTSTQVNFGVSTRGSETQYKGAGKLVDVVQSWMGSPYAVGLDSGIYLCSDYPTKSSLKTFANIESSEFCNRVSASSPYSRGSMAFSLISNGTTNSSNEILIDSNYGRGFTYKALGIFSSGEKIREVKEVSLRGVYYTFVVGSFEISFNIGDTAPTLNLQEGYFTNN